MLSSVLMMLWVQIPGTGTTTRAIIFVLHCFTCKFFRVKWFATWNVTAINLWCFYIFISSEGLFLCFDFIQIKNVLYLLWMADPQGWLHLLQFHSGNEQLVTHTICDRKTSDSSESLMSTAFSLTDSPKESYCLIFERQKSQIVRKNFQTGKIQKISPHI